MPETEDDTQPPGGTSDQLTVTFAKSGVTLIWDPSFPTILEFAEANGIDPVFGCRDGFCHSCKCTLIEGEVVYINPRMVVLPEEGQVLICYSRPKTNVVVDA
ncbi:MAG: 2Fe-2S iron-sulfur cluster-binding protein [Rhodospirillales bacterium]